MTGISCQEAEIPVIPPGNAQRFSGMHWLEIRSFGSGNFGMIALQWNPGSKTWTHSNAHDTFNGKAINTCGWRYVKPIPYPDLGE